MTVTGDHDLNAMLWLRQVVQSGDAGLIAIAVLRFMAKNEMFDRSETDAVLENLVG